MAKEAPWLARQGKRLFGQGAVPGAPAFGWAPPQLHQIVPKRDGCRKAIAAQIGQTAASGDKACDGLFHLDGHVFRMAAGNQQVMAFQASRPAVMQIVIGDHVEVDLLITQEPQQS